MKEGTSHVITMFLVICFAFGVMVGLAGLGIGLIFLNVSQGVGLGIVCFGGGALLGATFGAKRIMRALIETYKEMESKNGKV